MAEVIRTWLRSRLGVIIDLSPEIFGRYCRDGTFIAKLLHSYDIINDSQLQTITQTSDPALARVNLRHLRCWLRFIDVDCNDAWIEDISNGKGTASLRLFYKLFLCLENKDRLHFITLQKEREKYIPNSTKFDVKVVSEELPINDLPEHPLAAAFAKDNASLINWYKTKFQKIITDCQLDGEKFRASQVSNKPMKEPIFNKFRVLEPKETLKKNEMVELDNFTASHRVKSPIPGESPLDIIDRSKLFFEHSNTFGDPEAAEQFIRKLKCRKSAMNSTQNFKVQMQKTLLTDVWDRMSGEQEREFDRIIARKILDQSQYEKQMVRKLCDIRNQKNRMAANRKFVDELMINCRENEMRMIEETTREDIVRENEEVDDEYRRMNELNQRVKLAKQHRIKQKLYHSTKKIVHDIVDMALQAAEFKRANDNHIPMRIWNEWKALFHQNLPIFELSNDFDLREEIAYEGEQIEEFFDDELTKRNILNERDFEDYHQLNSPWHEFMPDIDEETLEYLHLGPLILGYIVHKLLNIVYPVPLASMKPPLPHVKIRSVVVGIPDSSLYSPFRELLKHRKIQVFAVEDAINYCLYNYKEEMKNYIYIDINVGSETDKKLSESLTLKEKRQLKKLKTGQRKSSKISNRNTASLLKTPDMNTDKETQTPKLIPYDDTHPQLSDTAYIGKCTHEILTHGDPIPDKLMAKIIVEYLKSLINIHGWVLLNYPKTHQQMAHLEFIFTGCKIPEQPDELTQPNSIATIDEIDPRLSRMTITFQDNDFSALCRESKLLPNPLERDETSSATTYLTTFIKMLPKPKNIVNVDTDELFELRPEDMTSIDCFYAEEGVAAAVYYNTCDILTLKRVATLIIRPASIQKSSTELPKDAFINSENNLDKNTDSRKSISKVQIKASSKSVITSSTPRSDLEIEQSKSDSHLVKPGQSDWIWADFYLAPEVIVDLVTFWENIEDSYIENLKEILALKRSKFSSIVPYKDFITRHMAEFLVRPNNKQELIRQFQVAFNDIPADMRDDEDVKCELYCRVDDFQAEIWNICDVRRREAEEERQRIINNHWTVMQVIILTNIYIGIIQSEMDRFIDTIKLIQNYYLSMLKRPINEKNISKFTLHKLTVDADNPYARGDGVSLKNSSVQAKTNKSMENNDNGSSIKEPPLREVYKSELEREVDNVLLNIDELRQVDVTQTSCFKIIQSNINYVHSIVDNIFISVNETLQKENDVTSSRHSSERRGKKRPSKRRLSERSNQSVDKILENQKMRNLFQEWQYVLTFEVNRIRMRLSILEAAKNSDIEFLLGTIQRAFFSIHRMLNEKYESEMRCVNDVAKIFCSAIEEEISIQEEIIFDGDNISIRPYVLMHPDNVEEPFNYIRENPGDLQFTISQLGRLKAIFHRVAPSGFISERAFIYILQDFLIYPNELPVISLLPAPWYELKQNDSVELVHELFGDISYIDWREFLIYAMEIQMPSQDELLDAKEAFADKDRDSTGIIHREHFILQRLWFINSSQSSALKSTLHEDFEKDEHMMFEEEFDIKSWKTNMTLSGKARKPRKTISFWINSIEKFDSHYEVQHEKLMRMTLIKELLCEMYLDSCYTFNYIAMLLAFCKDDDPIYGFGKALSLALGKRVCLEFGKGEQYVKMLLEERRLSTDDHTQYIYQRQDAIKFSEEFLMELLGKAIGYDDHTLVDIENFSITRINDTFRDSGPILIEKLDQPGGTIDPATLLIDDASPPMSPYPDDTDIYVSFEKLDKSSLSLRSDDQIINSKERELVYWLPINVCESVLSVLLPFEVIQNNISGTGISFIENLRLVYRDVACEQLNNVMNDAALIHRLVNHPFIIQLLQSTSKFTSKNLTIIVEKYLSNK